MNARVAAIGVGGGGIRLGRNDVQKCLLPLNGKPIVEHVIDSFESAGTELVVLLSGFLHEQVAVYLANTSIRACTLALVYGGMDGENPAICRLKPFLQEDFVYAGGDCIFPPSAISQLVDCAEANKGDVAVVAVTPHVEVAPTHARFLIEGDKVKAVASSSDPRATPFVTMGMYYIRPKAFAHLAKVSRGRPASAFIAEAIGAGETVSVCVIEDEWFCIHVPEDVERWNTSTVRKTVKS